MGIENDTRQKEGQPHHKGMILSDIGIENDTHAIEARDIRDIII